MNRFNSAYRKALVRNLSNALCRHGKILTTRVKAAMVRPYLEKLITFTKKLLRENENKKYNPTLQSKLYKDKIAFENLWKIARLNENRPGGYTSTIKCHRGSKPMAYIRIIDFPINLINTTDTVDTTNITNTI